MFTAGFIPGVMTALMIECVMLSVCVKHKYPEGKERPGKGNKDMLNSFWALLFPIIILAASIRFGYAN